jgi:hypothetical protein
LAAGTAITATEKYGLFKRWVYICTGGGALIRFLTGEELPVVKALRHAAKKIPGGKITDKVKEQLYGNRTRIGAGVQKARRAG